jgi:predicted transcriptional regulator
MRKTHKIAIVGSTVGILMAGGIAYAAWTSQDSGTGTVTAGSETGITVDATDATGLFPGQSKDILVTVANDNDYDVKLLTLAYVSADSSTDAAGCDVSNVDVDVTFAAGEVVPAGETSDEYTATVTMDDDAAEECQGAVFTLSFDGTADSNVA